MVGIAMFLLTFTLPHIGIEQYPIPRSSDLDNEVLNVPPGKIQQSATLVKGDVVHIEFEVTAGGNRDIDFNVNNGTNFFISETKVTVVNRNWTVPIDGTFDFVYDNSFSLVTSKTVSTHIVKYWNEIGYRAVTKYYPLLSPEFSYAGVIALLAGISIVFLGTMRRTDHKSTM